jgi:hypothetical protein
METQSEMTGSSRVYRQVFSSVQLSDSKISLIGTDCDRTKFVTLLVTVSVFLSQMLTDLGILTDQFCETENLFSKTEFNQTKK